jgi:hypothetical protein
VVAIFLATALVWSGIVEYVVTRHVTLHWSRVLVAAVGYLFALQCLITVSLRRILALWRHHLREAPHDIPGHRVHPSPASDPADAVAAASTKELAADRESVA